MVQPASAWLGKFIREVDQAIARILENPLASPVILRRHVLTKRLPYRFFFSLKGDAIVVHAVLHGELARVFAYPPKFVLKSQDPLFHGDI